MSAAEDPKATSAATMGMLAKRFSEHDRAQLRRLGATDPQVFWLERALPSIADYLEEPARFREVREELRKLRLHAVAIESWLARARIVPLMHAPKHVAFGHLQTAASTLPALRDRYVDLDDHFREDTLPRRFDFGVLTRALLVAIETAEGNFPVAVQSPRRSNAPAIAKIVEALQRPSDPESAAAAKALKVSRSRGSAFLALAEVVFARVGAKSPEHAIRQLLEARTAHSRAREPRAHGGE